MKIIYEFNMEKIKNIKIKSDKTYKKDGIRFEQVRKKWTIEKRHPLW